LTQNVDGIDCMSICEHLPLETMDEAAGFRSPHWRTAMAHTSLDDHWDAVRYQNRMHEIDLPILHISGWYDDEQVGTPLNFRLMTGHAASTQQLLMGPWGHAINTAQKLGEVDFGPEALIDLDGYRADWLDTVLGRGEPKEQAPVRIFVMGANVWRDEGEWPLARTRFTEYFLHSGGTANSRLGDGTLSTEVPADQPADAYTYHPARPVPFITDQKSSQIGGPDDYSA